MRAFSLVILGLVACASASFLEDGMEYKFQAEGGAASGTMDYSPHSSGFAYKGIVRMQTSGNQINILFEDMKTSQYVGGHAANQWPYDNTNFKPIDNDGPKAFAIVLNDDGTTRAVKLPSGLPKYIQNMMRGWASFMQVNINKINAGELGFTSKEKLLHGDCNVKYTVTDNKITKSVSHMADCENRKFRLIDDWRGYRCDMDWKNPTKRESTEPLYSNSNTVIVYEKKGGRIHPKVIGTSGNVMAQFFETEGVSHFAFTNHTLILIDSKSSPNDISVSGSEVDVAYEFSDDDYKWNVDRDLKAREPFFSTGEYFEDDASRVKAALKNGIMAQQKILETNSNDPEALERAHKYGVNTLLPAFYAMDYDNLKSLADELSSDPGHKQCSNIFNELIGSAGTTAAALVIRDMVMEGKFDNDRDAGRALTAVPFHIRRPNKQLVEEFEKLENFNGDRFVKMAIPLTFGHLVRMTCERAGAPFSQEQRECFQWSKKYSQKAFDKFRSATKEEEKSTALAVLSNIRYGGISDMLKPVIYGEGEYASLSDQLRVDALWASGWDAIMTGKGVSFFMPIFADQTLDHEIRLAAAQMIMYSKPSATDLSTMMVTMYTEKDYEVINFVFSLLERYANSINPCDEDNQEVAKYFLKYMKQYSGYETDWGFGVSKTYTRQFHKKKYGYSGAYTFYTIGSHKSTTPLTFGMSISNTMFHSYENNMFHLHLRIEGLAKRLVKKFKKMDPTTWDMGTLQEVFMSMGIKNREEQPLHVEVVIMYKGVIVIHRHYDEESTTEEGRLTRFLEDLKDMGDEYAITHQRAIQVGSMLYEQPTDFGLPMAYMNGVTTMASIDAKVKRGSNRGLLYRNVEYDANLFTQGVNIMMIHNPGRKASYGIVQDRIYKAHVPRKMTVGVNVVKRELKMMISRPPYDDPLMMMMHSQTSVLVRGNNIEGKYNGLKDNCPQCEDRVVVSKGPEAVKSRVIMDKTNKNAGAYVHAEYFDCEMDIGKANTVKNAVGAFMPYNKNPKTLWTSIMMGMRQTRAFFIFFPRAEKCGAMFRWSQSKENPVSEYEIMISGSGEANGEKMFFRGRSIRAKVLIKAIGEPVNRNYKINLIYKYAPGYLENELKVLFQRQGQPEIGMSPYSACVNFENKYPDFSEEFMSYKKNEQMTVNGKASIKYGAVKSCSAAEGEINVKFAHSTTPEARNDMKNTWYYKQCMEQKATPAWSNRDSYPITEACYQMVRDATTARKYTWDVEFAKVTPRMKVFISKARTLMQAGLLPYWDVDPDTLDDSGSANDDPRLKVEAIFKDNDKNLDLTVETSQGTNEFDIPLSLDWTNRLRNLKFTNTLRRLYQAKIIAPCMVTTTDVRTLDNVTYPYTPSSCWTLMSGHCAEDPNFAVFTKKMSGMMAARVYVGGHQVEFTPSGPKKITVTVNGEPVSVGEGSQYTHEKDGTEILNIVKWGSTYNLYSFLKVWVVYDGNFMQVVPAPSTRGQHCGMCGNFNRNQYDEFTGKDDTLLKSADEMADSWKYKC